MKITHARSTASEEDQTPQVSGPLVAQRTRRVDQSPDSIGLDGAADERAAPGGCGGGGLLGLEEFFFGIGLLGAVVGVSEDGGEDCERGGVGEDCAEGDGGGLDGWEIWGK